MTPEGWMHATLGEISDIRRGASPRPIGDAKWFSDDGPGWVRIIDVTRSNRFLRATEQKLSPLGVARSVSVKPGDLIMSICATIGRPIIVDMQACIHDGFVLFDKLSKQVDELFLYYFLFDRGPKLAGLGQQGTQSNLNTGIVKGTAICIPPLPEQKKIAAILGSVDEAIAATQAVIDQTRKVKQGLLARLLTRGIGHTRFKKTEIGEIPEEWEVVPLRDVVSQAIRNGYSPVCPKDPTGIWILSLGAVTPSGFNAEAVKPAPVDDQKVQDFLLRPGDFLVSRSNTRDRVGFTSLYRGEIENCAYPDLLMRFRVDNQRLSNDFVELYLSSSIALAILQNAAAGTSGSMVKINKRILESLPVPIPTLAEQGRISTAMRAARKTEASHRECLASLTIAKRGLMQDLLTGRVRAMSVA